jgi:guanylate kinase
VRDSGFDARLILLMPPNNKALKDRLKEIGETEEAISSVLEKATQETGDAKVEEGFELVIVNEDLEGAFKVLQDHIYEASARDSSPAIDQTGEIDLPMGDAEMNDAEQTNDSDPSRT